MAELGTVRTDLHTALSAIDNVEVYRRRPTNPQFPVIVVGWPQSLDVNATMGGARNYVIPVDIGVVVTDDESADTLLEELYESVVPALQETHPTWEVRTATESGEQILADGRVVIWYRVPVAVFA